MNSAEYKKIINTLKRVDKVMKEQRSIVRYYKLLFWIYDIIGVNYNESYKEDLKQLDNEVQKYFKMKKDSKQVKKSIKKSSKNK